MELFPETLLNQISDEGMSELIGGASNDLFQHIDNGSNCDEINNGNHCDVINNGQNCSKINNKANCSAINNKTNCK